jgi:hypothetical protein
MGSRDVLLRPPRWPGFKRLPATDVWGAQGASYGRPAVLSCREIW